MAGRPRPLHTKIEFARDDALFSDVGRVHQRGWTLELPESHADALRPDAFPALGTASSLRDRSQLVLPEGRDGEWARDRAFPSPDGAGACVAIPEAFRSKDPAWPIIATQFHVEQRDFASAGAGECRRNR